MLRRCASPHRRRHDVHRVIRGDGGRNRRAWQIVLCRRTLDPCRASVAAALAVTHIPRAPRLLLALQRRGRGPGPGRGICSARFVLAPAQGGDAGGKPSRHGRAATWRKSRIAMRRPSPSPTASLNLPHRSTPASGPPHWPAAAGHAPASAGTRRPEATPSTCARSPSPCRWNRYARSCCAAPVRSCIAAATASLPSRSMRRHWPRRKRSASRPNASRSSSTSASCIRKWRRTSGRRRTTSGPWR